MRIKGILIAAGILAIILIAGYFIARNLVRKKVDAALEALPPSVKVTYVSLSPSILSRSLIINGLNAHVSQDSQAYVIDADRVSIEGIGFWAMIRHHRLELGHVECSGLKIGSQDSALSLEGSLELDSVEKGAGTPEKADSLRVGGIRLLARKIRYRPRETDEVMFLHGLDLDSRSHQLRLDTFRIAPTLDKLEIGRKKGHQVDVVEGSSEGIQVDGLDVMGLLQHRLTADRISVGHCSMYVFRDRRLPLVQGDKALPMEGLRSLPVILRVGRVSIGPMHFVYEEYPKVGDQTGTLKIYRMTATLEPLINRPVAGDPAYLTMKTRGSLMNSGSVTATTRIPLHKGDPYQVEGAFHELDVTSLNDPAENLGKLHLESGMLNFLSFQFDMTNEKSTGKIIGEYHDLVVDKLKDNGKVAKLKSFALKKFIIPKNKDRSLPEKKRTGKVDYKRDPQRYFSYYLLHSLLVGVKSSFSLGFLLPG